MKTKSIKSKIEKKIVKQKLVKKAIKKNKKNKIIVGSMITFDFCNKMKPCVAIVVKKEKTDYSVLNLRVCEKCFDEETVEDNFTTVETDSSMLLL